MRGVNRTSILSAILLGCVLFVPPINTPTVSLVGFISDLFDSRPERTALFIGNSRTFYHDMPKMVRWIADSADHAEKLEIEMDAQPGVSLSDHQESPQTQALIAKGWDYVVLQVLSSEQYSAQQSSQVWEAATELIEEIRAAGSSPAMFVTWRYTDQCSDNSGLPQSAIGLPASGYANMHLNIQEQHARLAALTGVDLVNVGLIWEKLQSSGIPLYDDCNHPSIYGSYLAALMFYGYFTGNDVTNVTYKPAEVSLDQAQVLRTTVSQYLNADDLPAV